MRLLRAPTVGPVGDGDDRQEARDLDRASQFDRAVLLLK